MTMTLEHGREYDAFPREWLEGLEREQQDNRKWAFPYRQLRAGEEQG